MIGAVIHALTVLVLAPLAVIVVGAAVIVFAHDIRR